MLERIRNMVRKEFIQIFRDKRVKFTIFFAPIFQLIIFGYAVTTDIRNIPTAIYNFDTSFESRELIRRFSSSGYFKVIDFPASPHQLRDLIDKGKVTTIIQINRGFARDLKRGVPAKIQLIFDGTDSNAALLALNYANRIISNYSAEIKNSKMKDFYIQVDARPRVWYNPELKSRNYNVPAVIALIITLVSFLLTSMAIVREREIGTIEQLMVTPLKPYELMVGKAIPFAIIAFFDMVLITIVSIFWFKIPIKGSFLLLAFSTAIYLLSVLGMGLFISTIARTQQQALMTTFLFFLPIILLSGFMFPIENMPKIIQYATYINPLRYFLVIIRGIFLKGNGIDILWQQIGALVIIGAAVLTMSSLRFKKRLE